MSKKYITLGKLSTFFDNLKLLFATKADFSNNSDAIAEEANRAATAEDALLSRIEALEKMISNSPLYPNLGDVGVLDAGTIMDSMHVESSIIDKDTIT